MAQPEKKEIKIELTPEVAQGKYAKPGCDFSRTGRVFHRYDMSCAKHAPGEGAKPHNHDTRECEAADVCPSGQYQEI